jgi:transcriptional regulator with XRE-family HTH domain
MDKQLTKLKAYKQMNDANMEEIAELLGTNVYTLSRWFNGVSKISNVYRKIIDDNIPDKYAEVPVE